MRAIKKKTRRTAGPSVLQCDRFLSLRWIIVITVAVTLADLTIPAVNKMFNAGVLGDLTSPLDRFRLRVVNRRRPITSRTHIGPAVLARNGVHILISSHSSLLLSLIGQ